jgi:hypothetical protein
VSLLADDISPVLYLEAGSDQQNLINIKDMIVYADGLGLRLFVFNTVFYSILVISYLSVLFVGKPLYPEKNPSCQVMHDFGI